MMNFLRTALTNVEQEQLDEERYVASTQRWHGSRATQQVNTYQNDRHWKSNFIVVNVVAEGYDIKRFLEALVKEKSKSNCNNFCRVYTQHRLFLEGRTKECGQKVQAGCSGGQARRCNLFRCLYFLELTELQLSAWLKHRSNVRHCA